MGIAASTASGPCWLNNCTWEDRSLALTLDASWGLPDGRKWDLYRWYPSPARLKGDADTFGPKVAITLRPFEVVLLEAVPAGERPTLDRELPVQPVPTIFAEPSRTIDVKVSDANAKEDASIWTVLTPASAVSTGGATLTKQADDSILATGNNPSPDTYTITADTKLTNITGIRLEAMADPQLPSHGPGRAYNGNFALSEFTVTAAPVGKPADARPVKLHKPAASFSQGTYGGWPVAAAIDGDPKTAWSIDPRKGETQIAVFELPARRCEFQGGDTLTFTTRARLSSPKAAADHTIGRFRLSATAAAKTPIPPPVSRERRTAVTLVRCPRAPHLGPGGTIVVISAELSTGSASRSYLGDIGHAFRRQGKARRPARGRAGRCSATGTYPSCWQAWRVNVRPSTSQQSLRLAASVPFARRGEVCVFGVTSFQTQ